MKDALYEENLHFHPLNIRKNYFLRGLNRENLLSLIYVLKMMLVRLEPSDPFPDNIHEVLFLLRKCLRTREPLDSTNLQRWVSGSKENVSSLPTHVVTLLYKASLTTLSNHFLLLRSLLLRKLTKTARLMYTFSFSSRTSSLAVGQTALMLEVSGDWVEWVPPDNSVNQIPLKKTRNDLGKEYLNNEYRFKKLHTRILSFYLGIQN